eukprot:897933-Amorphochlora_amoeboformis.AAC.1
MTTLGLGLCAPVGVGHVFGLYNPFARFANARKQHCQHNQHHHYDDKCPQRPHQSPKNSPNRSGNITHGRTTAQCPPIHRTHLSQARHDDTVG